MAAVNFEDGVGGLNQGAYNHDSNVSLGVALEQSDGELPKTRTRKVIKKKKKVKPGQHPEELEPPQDPNGPVIHGLNELKVERAQQ